MRFVPLKVGELARRTGLTVRTLHHYDAIGLLRPSLYTEAGHRLYSAADVARLHRVLSLRQLGFALEEIRDCLDAPGFAPLDLLERQIERLREQMALAQQLCTRLEGLAAYFRSAGEVPAEEFLHTMEVMTMMENLYTPEQRQQFDAIAKQVGQSEIRAIEEGWTALLAEVRANHDRDPASPEAQALLERWE
jgi:DNA-binding transcriptional MerR regulator